MNLENELFEVVFGTVKTLGRRRGEAARMSGVAIAPGLTVNSNYAVFAG